MHDAKYEIHARNAGSTRVADDDADALRTIGGPGADDSDAYRLAKRLAVIDGHDERAAVQGRILGTRANSILRLYCSTFARTSSTEACCAASRSCASLGSLGDARNEPMPSNATRTAKRRLLDASLLALVEKVQGLVEPDTRVVLISHAVYAICCEPLGVAGINVVNTEMIDFPSSGRKKEFQRKLGRALDEFLDHAIQGLEVSVKFFGAGKTQQQERDRWVVAHFLRGLGLTFDVSEIVQPEHDPPDATFLGAAFEVREIQERSRQRGDEYKQQLAKARAAKSSDELLEHFTPQDISIAEVYRRIMGERPRDLLKRSTVPKPSGAISICCSI